MCKKYFSRFLSLLCCLAIILSSFTYADTVVIGVAPGSADGRTMSANTNTTYLQNQYTGPGTTPNSSMTGLTPIQGVSYAQTAGQNPVDANGVGNYSPTTTSIKSPAVNNKTLTTSTGDVNVVANNSAYNRNGTDSSTADKGPTVQEIKSPSAADSNSVISSSAAGPDRVANTSVTVVENNTNTQAQTAVTTDAIIYHTNDNIMAVKPGISASAAIVVNATTRQIYYAKGGLTQHQPASLANLVTAAILVANKNLNDTLTVSNSAVSNLESGAVTAKLRAGDVITVRDAIGAMFVGSCCDVANVVAENIAGSISNFVNIMNQTVKSWGCVSTNFTNPTGLNNNAQLTTTYDMAIIMDKVTSNPSLKLMLTQATYVLPATTHREALPLNTKNWLLVKGNANYYDGISASRMGYTSKALYTIASELDYHGQRFIAVVLKSSYTQWNDTKKLLNFAKVASLEPSSQNVSSYITTFKTASDVASNAMTTTTTTTTNNVVDASSAPASRLPISSINTTQAAGQGGEATGSWAQDASGWFFIRLDGTRAVNEWIRQNGKLYCIDASGYMITGWRQMSNGNMYYFDPNTGELKFNTWINVSTGSYYLQSDGSLAKADSGGTKNIITSVGTYVIDDTGKAIAKIS